MWIKLDEDFYSHPKVVRAGPEAAHLYVAGLGYCSKHLTDGWIPTEALPMLTSFVKNVRRAAGVLVAVELWHKRDDGYEVHDYLEVQSSRSDVEKIRQDAASRARSSRERRANQSRSSPDVREPELELEIAQDPSDLSRAAPKEKRKRRPNPIFDALVEVWGEAVTDSERSRYGKVAAELKDADPAEVVRRGNLCLQRFDHPTVMALTANWTSLGATPAKPRSHFDGLES